MAGKYLKEWYELHAQRATLDVHKDSIGQLCLQCKNGPTCVEWHKVQELPCFYLESIF